MRCDHAARERNVGQILAVGIVVGVRKLGGTAQREIVTSGGRRPEPVR
jgi:hypothetical protein